MVLFVSDYLFILLCNSYYFSTHKIPTAARFVYTLNQTPNETVNPKNSNKTLIVVIYKKNGTPKKGAPLFILINPKYSFQILFFLTYEADCNRCSKFLFKACSA